MKQSKVTLVSFLGGPFDGHAQTVSYPPEELNVIAVLPVNANILNWVSGVPLGPRRPATSLAIYALERDGEEISYLFLGPSAPETHPEHNWMG
jgi:hypothetical protein